MKRKFLSRLADRKQLSPKGRTWPELAEILIAADSWNCSTAARTLAVCDLTGATAVTAQQNGAVLRGIVP